MLKDYPVFKHLEDFYNRWILKLIPEKVEEEEIYFSSSKKRNYFLILLKITPWITLIIFLITLFYDPLENFIIHLPWKKENLVLTGILRMLAVTGLVGYGTNYIAIKMLFHPREKRPLLGQGLIPASKIKIAYKLGESISREIINHELIANQMKKSGIIQKYLEQFNQSFENLIQLEEFRKDFLKLIEQILNSILHSEEFKKNIKNFVKTIDFENLQGIESGLIKIYKWLKGDQEITKKIEEIILSLQINLKENEEQIFKYLNEIPEFLKKNQNSMENILINAISFLIERINIKKVMIENLLALNELRLEKLILYSTSDQLDYIQYLGCILGILGGFFIWLPFESFVLFSFLGIIIFLIDELIYRYKKK